ncbi:MAG: M48 family metallopeptidase [Campylobacteraceae bacterium]|jgi:Zn-dependent protease with chaperone function|nr:M48 family metallopeptidase [Campylobacteraceae bacterium]
MNFFERQKRAKNNSTFLIVLFFAAVIAICLCVSGALFVIVKNDLKSIYDIIKFTIVSFFATLSVIFLGSIYKIGQLSKGGGAFVAESLGGTRVLRQGANANEIMLLNIVEEISIASGVSVPPVYILKDESINAFAAGLGYDDAVIGVTKGAVKYLNRDELQGVIAHEFSHILNGDMRLNIRSIGILHGILFINLIGWFMVKIAGILSASSGSKEKDNIQQGIVIITIILFIVGVLLYIIGLIGVFFGNIIKAAINRQREYLADASAVQFTRFPLGLANALKKIGGSSSDINSINASEFSHLYFSSSIKSFFSLNTHPPLNKRIKALHPNWDGKYISPEPIRYDKSSIQKPVEKDNIMKTITLSTILNEINNIGIITLENLETASKKIDKIPELLYKNSMEMFSAQFVIFALLLDKNEDIRKIQTDIIMQSFLVSNNEVLKKDFEAMISQLPNLPRDTYLTIIQISLSALKTLSKEQYLKFKHNVIALIEADKNVSWFEHTLKYLILYPLDIVFGVRKIPQEIYSHMETVKFDIEIILSAIIYTQFSNDEKANTAFNQIMKTSDANMRYISSENISAALLEKAYFEVQKAKPFLRKKILEMAISCLKIDGELSEQDLETIHALCALLHLPVSI